MSNVSSEENSEQNEKKSTLNSIIVTCSLTLSIVWFFFSLISHLSFKKESKRSVSVKFIISSANLSSVSRDIAHSKALLMIYFISM